MPGLLGHLAVMVAAFVVGISLAGRSSPPSCVEMEVGTLKLVRALKDGTAVQLQLIEPLDTGSIAVTSPSGSDDIIGALTQDPEFGRLRLRRLERLP